MAYFVYVQDFDNRYEIWRALGVQFLEKPRGEPYGKVAQFCDLYGNKWDLIEAI